MYRGADLYMWGGADFGAGWVKGFHCRTVLFSDVNDFVSFFKCLLRRKKAGEQCCVQK